MATVAELVTMTTTVGANYVELLSRHPSKVDKLLSFKVFSSGKVKDPLPRFHQFSRFDPIRS